jgi:hypothetical protein
VGAKCQPRGWETLVTSSSNLGCITERRYPRSELVCESEITTDPRSGNDEIGVIRNLAKEQGAVEVSVSEADRDPYGIMTLPPHPRNLIQQFRLHNRTQIPTLRVSMRKRNNN